MKIFDFKNPRHVEILHEELSRAKKILREYNESNEWKQMPEEWRALLLAAADDDMGPDFADEYSNEDWMNIPDSITNRIDISSNTLPEKYNKTALIDILNKNKTKLGQTAIVGNHNVSDVIRFMESGNPSRYYVYQVLAALHDVNMHVPMSDLKSTGEYTGGGTSDQSIIGQWIQSDRAKGKNYGFD
jgi:hypothetical protein